MYIPGERQTLTRHRTPKDRGVDASEYEKEKSPLAVDDHNQPAGTKISYKASNSKILR